MTSEFPRGPLPEGVGEFIQSIVREVGVCVLKKKDLHRRLAIKYQIDFSPHEEAVDEILEELFQTPEYAKKLAKAMQDEKKTIGGKGRERSASPTKKSSKKSKVEKSTKETKAEKNAKRPENYPKGAKTPFIFFSVENRETVRQQNPELTMGKIGAELGRMWNNMDNAEKQKYVAMAEEDKKRFEEEMRAYEENGGEKLKSKKSSKDESGPKRGLSAYMFFGQDFRKKHPDLSMKDSMRDAGAAWKALSDSEKGPYEAMAAEDKKRYEKEKAEQRK